MSKRLALLIAALGLFGPGCAILTTRFDQAVTTSFASQPMRKYETRNLELYYPARYQAEALRVAGRLTQCIDELRALPVTKKPRPKLVVYLTTANFNNAYVEPESGGFPNQMVLAHHMTLELFNWFELGESEIGDISCHEAVHYVQFQQTDDFWEVLNLVLGSGIQPNIFTESWFLEGLAVHYEGRLGKETGRPNSPMWLGMFESGAATDPHLNAGYLNVANRRLYPFGGNYVVGMQFVDYLARTYGEDKLWKLVDKQGRSIFSPFGVTLRFKAVYGKSIGALFDDFVVDVHRHTPPRFRPADQKVLVGNAGYLARVAVSPRDGAVAAVTAMRDQEARLTMYEPDGKVRFSRRLTPILPPRRWLEGGPELVSGMSFTADGAWLYLMSVDVGENTDDVTRLFRINARTGDVDRIWDGLHGLGGAVSPDGTSYVYVSVTGDTANLARFDLATGTSSPLTDFSGTSSLGAPATSPDGRQIVFSRFTGEGFDLFLRRADGTVEALTSDGEFNYAPRWVDDHRIAFMREDSGRAQVFQFDLQTRQLAQVTDAPYIALDPSPTPSGTLVFVNRDGWSWSIDEVPLAAHGTPTVAAAPRPVSLEPGKAPPGVDRAYSPVDHLFAPILHAPFGIVYARSGHFEAIAGLSLSGSDRLGLHNYALNVWDDTALTGPSISAGYANYQLAPWLLSLTFSRGPSTGNNLPFADYSGDLSASRVFWTSPITFGFQGIQRVWGPLSAPVERDNFLGPHLSYDYVALDGTPYAGIQRALALSLSLAGYPSALGSSVNMADIRGEADAIVPLPLLKRHELGLSLVGRALPGAPDGLLQVGGISSALGLFQKPRDSGSIGPLTPAYPVAFSEYLRGYDDFGIFTNDVAIANARYRYRIPIDYGWASTLYLFSSPFIRQVDLDLFADAARTWGPGTDGWHRAAGGQVALRLLFGQVLPVSLFYQFAYRFDDGLRPLHFVGLALQ